MSKSNQLKPEEANARAYADRLILEQLTELEAAVKLSELADRLQKTGINLSAVRGLLSSNPEKFAYHERRWVPAARLEADGRPLQQAVKLHVDRFGGPMPLPLLVHELSHARHQPGLQVEAAIVRIVNNGNDMFLTELEDVALADWAFVATDELPERGLKLNGVTKEEAEEVKAKLGRFDWKKPNAVSDALTICAPVKLKVLGAVAWLALNSPDPRSKMLFDWRSFASKALSTPEFVYSSDNTIHAAADAKKWVSAAIKLAEKLAPTIEVEDAAPIEVKKADVDKMVAKLKKSDTSITATGLLEEFYEITPSVKTFPDDLENLMTALKKRDDLWWVGGDRFAVPNSAPEFVEEIPELFEFPKSNFKDEDGDPVDFELEDEGLSSSLRKLLTHPLALDVLDEEPLPAPKQLPEQLRLVLRPIHRELGTYPVCQFPVGWFSEEPRIQELIFIDSSGKELQVWANMEARLLFNLFDWWFEQPIESGAVFSLTRTDKPNVFEFAWMDQPDPVVYISNQRMEELREIQSRAEELSTLDILREVMAHWPKGADFLTILWEVNVVRRSTRRLIASLLSSYHSFYQRSGSPVWHYDSKKVEQGVDKTKKKFIIK